MPDPIVGIVLAAGSSSRLGRPKQLEPIDGRPLIVHTIKRTLLSKLEHLVVVVGAEEVRVRKVIFGHDVDVVSNPCFATGQASSVIAGVKRAQELGADAVIFLLADQPGISPTAIDGLVAARRSGGAIVGMTQYGSRPAHPVMFGREVFPELLAITGDMGGREIIQRHKAQLILVDGERESVPADLDCDDDVDSVRNDLRTTSQPTPDFDPHST